MRKEKGITLVALIVTVVILIILAGVSLNLAFSDSGLIKKAEYAVNKSENSDENTQKKLNETKEWLDKNPDNDDAEPLPSTSETFPYYPSYKFDKTEDSDLDSGLVIEDRKGNQYVWVEVPKTNEVYPTAGINIVSFSSTEYTKIENDLHTYTSVYRKNTMSTDTYYSGCGLSSTSYDMLKQKMLKSVYQNGGFWIGRYETGLTNRYRTYGEEYYTEHPITDTPVIKCNAYPYVWVRCAQAQTLASNMYSGNYTSSLLFGVQWDLTLKYLETKGINQKLLNEDSTEIGNYPNTVFTITNGKYSLDQGANWSTSIYTKKAGKACLHTTGAIEQFKMLNIYDLAGNIWEWTLENSGYASTPCRSRGGDFRDLDGTDTPASARNLYGKEGDATANCYHGVGFRVTIY